MWNDPFFEKFMSRVARMLSREYQRLAPTMTSEEIIEDQEFFPMFNPDRHQYLDKSVGYVCRTLKGNVVHLLQPYDSTICKEEPENLSEKWGFYWSKDPNKATEFVKTATSPYSIGDCCMENGDVYRSVIDDNMYAPSEYEQGWVKILGEEE